MNILPEGPTPQELRDGLKSGAFICIIDGCGILPITYGFRTSIKDTEKTVKLTGLAQTILMFVKWAFVNQGSFEIDHMGADGTLYKELRDSTEAVSIPTPLEQLVNVPIFGKKIDDTTKKAGVLLIRGGDLYPIELRLAFVKALLRHHKGGFYSGLNEEDFLALDSNNITGQVLIFKSLSILLPKWHDCMIASMESFGKGASVHATTMSALASIPSTIMQYITDLSNSNLRRVVGDDIRRKSMELGNLMGERAEQSLLSMMTSLYQALVKPDFDFPMM